MKKIILIVVLILAAVVGGLFYLGHKSGSGAAPGLVAGQLTDCPSSPNCVSSKADSTQDSQVEPFSVEIWGQIPAAIEAMGGTVTRQEERYIAAEFTSDLFGFTDVIEFRLVEDVVHVRSASRVGHSDMGANRKRVEALRERLGNL